MAFDPEKSGLPINDVISDIKTALEQENTLIVGAPPGAGKSTILPLALMEETWLKGKKILMLEPRRLAARSVAIRMASLIGEKAGQSVGFRIRFENKVSDQTKVEVLTEGILTRMIQDDNSLSDIGMVIFDEFHERSIHADVAMAFCREVQKVLRPDLRIMIMSATLDMPKLSQLLGAPVIKSDGKLYPVEVKYVGEHDLMLLPEMVSKTVLDASKKHDGDILVFLPGQGEIRKCETILQGLLREFKILPLYGQLPQNQQYAAIMPNTNGQRKVVLATSIAETSLTIEGIKVVVDAGFVRSSKFDPNSGLSRLHTTSISKDSADQRTGRAGRLSPGTCYRMWSLATNERLASHRIPEIKEADLAPVMLDLAQWGIQDANELTWLTPPPSGTLAQAKNILEQLGAIKDGKLTHHGRKMHKLPCHPRIAHMLIMADEGNNLALATDVAAIIEERDPLPKDSGIDLTLRIEMLRRQREDNRLSKGMSRVEKVAQSYRRIFNIETENVIVDTFEAGVLIAHAYPERIACARPGNNAQFQLSNGRIAMAGHRDDLAHEAWLAVAHVDARDGMGKIFMAAPLNPSDLAPLVKSKEVIKWDSKDGGLTASLDLRIGSIVLSSKPLPDPDPELVTKVISDAVCKEGTTLLNFNEEVGQWQNRVLSLRKWRPDEAWPDVSTTQLLASNERWLTPYLQGIKRPEDLKKLNLSQILLNHLEWSKQEALNKLAPARIEVPSGSKIALEYQADGSVPVLAARLQELFGLAQTPVINEGLTPVLIHLLSPGFKPVQVTSDLKSFWDNTYFEVKKEMKRRYPKHHWPDDPWTSEAVKGLKRKPQ